MTNDRKKELFPFFAYIYSKQLNPEKYGTAKNFDEWSKLLEGNPEDSQKIIQAASGLSEAEWTSVEEQLNNIDGNSSIDSLDQQEVQTESVPTLSKKGSKLEYLSKLNSYKKGKKMTKKCGCGCDMVEVKEEGGKITETCSCKCGGKMKKKK